MWLRVLTLALVLMVLAAAVSAQDALVPLVVLDDGGVYAVSPVDGAVQVLVAPHTDHDALRALTGDPITVFSASWLSPDGRYLAYRTFVPDALDGGEAPIRHALFVLDLETGESLPVTMAGGGERVRIVVDSLAWSPDAMRLYVSGTCSNANAADAWLQIVERDAWDSGRTVRAPQANYAMARSLLPASHGVVLFDRGMQSPRYILSTYSEEGDLANQFVVDGTLLPDVNLYVNTPFNPLHMGNALAYGISRQMSGELAYIANFEKGFVAPFEPGFMPALVSGVAPDTSLRVTTSLFSGDMTGLHIRGADGELLGDIAFVRAFAYGIDGDSVGSTFALSPDGQTLAWLEDGTVRLWHDGETSELDVNADALAWAPVLHVPVDVGAWFAG